MDFGILLADHEIIELFVSQDRLDYQHPSPLTGHRLSVRWFGHGYLGEEGCRKSTRGGGKWCCGVADHKAGHGGGVHTKEENPRGKNSIMKFVCLVEVLQNFIHLKQVHGQSFNSLFDRSEFGFYGDKVLQDH